MGKYGWIILVMFGMVVMENDPFVHAIILERPVEGQTVVVGEPYDVWVRPAPGEVCDSVGPGLSFNEKTGRYEGTHKIDPEELREASEQFRLGIEGEGRFCRNAKVTVTVILPPTTVVRGIGTSFTGDKETFLEIARKPGGELVVTEGTHSTSELSVSAIYSDSVLRDIITNPGVKYTSANEKVAIVFPPGQGKDSFGDVVKGYALVRATGPGKTSIIVQYGEFTDRVTVNVKECPYIEGKMKHGCPLR